MAARLPGTHAIGQEGLEPNRRYTEARYSQLALVRTSNLLVSLYKPGPARPGQPSVSRRKLPTNRPHHAAQGTCRQSASRTIVGHSSPPCYFSLKKFFLLKFLLNKSFRDYDHFRSLLFSGNQGFCLHFHMLRTSNIFC